MMTSNKAIVIIVFVVLAMALVMTPNMFLSVFIQSNDAQTVDNWDSNSASQVQQIIHNDVCKSNGLEPVDTDCIMPKMKPNGLPVHVSLTGPLRQAVEWESDLEENSSDSECKSLGHSIHPSSVDDDGETRFAVCDKNYGLPEVEQSRPKSEATSGGQNYAKAVCLVNFYLSNFISFLIPSKFNAIETGMSTNKICS